VNRPLSSRRRTLSCRRPSASTSTWCAANERLCR
jgi:hypothetical protein